MSNFAIFCLAASLAASSAQALEEQHPFAGSAGRLQKRSPDEPAFPEGTSTISPPPLASYPSLPYCCPPCPQPTATCSQQSTLPPELSRELPLGQQGSLQVRCDGGLVLQFYVEYRVRGQRITKESGTFTNTLRRTIDIPADAEDISLTVQNVVGAATSDIMKKQWKYPVIRCYSSVDGRSAKKVGCS